MRSMLRTGSAIIGYRIDVFVGFENDVDNSLTNSGRIGNMESLSVYDVDDETASKVKQRFGLEVPDNQ